MDITAEKEDIIRKFRQLNDVDVIRAIQNILDLNLSKQDQHVDNNKIALNASIDRAIKNSLDANVRPYEDFIADARKRRRA